MSSTNVPDGQTTPDAVKVPNGGCGGRVKVREVVMVTLWEGEACACGARMVRNAKPKAPTTAAKHVTVRAIESFDRRDMMKLLM
jgi:hypothetical protein